MCVCMVHCSYTESCALVDTEKNVDMEDLVDEFLMFYLAGMKPRKWLQ